MTQPLVSILINNHNYGEFLGRAIDGCLDQTYDNVEVVVVDDGSTDDSRSIIESYGDRIRPYLQENRGQPAAVNKGYEHSRGDIIIFLDSDDKLYPEAVEEVVRVWDENTSKVQFYMAIVDGEDRPLPSRRPHLAMEDGDMEALVRHWGFYPSPPTSGNAFARSLLERIMPVHETTWRSAPDVYLVALAPFYGRIVSIHRTLADYRVHNRNQSGLHGGLDPVQLRRKLQNQVDCEIAVKEHAAALGRPIEGSLNLHNTTHLKQRLLSLKCDPKNHPFAGDTVGRLVVHGIRAAWSFPHYSLRQRLIVPFGFVLLALAPSGMLRHGLDPILYAEKRWKFLRGLLVHRSGGSLSGP